MYHSSYFFAIILMTMTIAFPAQATVLPAQSLDQMIQASPQIVLGKVRAMRSFWGPGKRHIYTEIRLEVSSYLKGSGASTLLIHKLGGRQGALISQVPGSASYRIGEELVVFLEPKRHPTFRFVLGMAAGKYRVLRKDGRVYLHRSLQGLAFHSLPKPGVRPQVQERNYSEPALTLQQLQQRIAANRGKLPRFRTLQPAPGPKLRRYMQLLRRQRWHPKNQSIMPLRRLTKPTFGVLLPVLRSTKALGRLPQRTAPAPRRRPAVFQKHGRK